MMGEKKQNDHKKIIKERKAKKGGWQGHHNSWCQLQRAGLITLCVHDKWILDFDWGPPYKLDGYVQKIQYWHLL